jgi:predicted metal-dependent hydrolase
MELCAKLDRRMALFNKSKTSVEQISYAGFDLQLKRSSRRRRTLSLRITAPDKITVSAPWKTPVAEVHRMLDARKDWIQAQLKKTARIVDVTLSGDEGDFIYYLGKPLSLRYSLAAENTIALRENESELRLLHTSPLPNKSAAITKIRKNLRADANTLLPKRVNFWSEKMNLQPANILIKQYKAQWGSCSRAGEVRLNWRLIGASREVIDYVVVHELAHLTFFNHSADFWLLVAKYQPNYKTHKRWLTTWGPKLMI